MGTEIVRDGNRSITIISVADVYEYGGFVFEFHKYCGPALCKKNGELRKNTIPGLNHPFWHAFDRWMKLPPEEREEYRWPKQMEEQEEVDDRVWQLDGSTVKIPIKGSGAMASAYCGRPEIARIVFHAPEMLVALGMQETMMCNLISDCRNGKRLDPERIAGNLELLLKDVGDLINSAKGK